MSTGTGTSPLAYKRAAAVRAAEFAAAVAYERADPERAVAFEAAVALERIALERTEAESAASYRLDDDFPGRESTEYTYLQRKRNEHILAGALARVARDRALKLAATELAERNQLAESDLARFKRAVRCAEPNPERDARYLRFFAAERERKASCAVFTAEEREVLGNVLLLIYPYRLKTNEPAPATELEIDDPDPDSDDDL